ncbi:chloride channel ClC-3 [Naegleria gruberi]|uniref:Chloride channel protein n=1 Tax=Naegleria gruberi TaxID=5762 RepID=D2W1T3_NAEGR|nr:chloride channel ClC-3 [Naegleria gruberi]EFC37022.1 chloride channel ClC-3 [Naegleria gruberi]|eukprot:XP_002669766.1 chloride channel ClC-3 [Naegleria gruberi strain NEG-M]
MSFIGSFSTDEEKDQIRMSLLTTTNPEPPKNPYHDNENISTIDWRADIKKERKNRAKLYSKTGIWATLHKGYYASQGWIMTFLIGAWIGIFASIVDKGMEWLAGFKEGVCVNYFLATQTRCCVEVPVGIKCEDWKTWSEIFGIYETNGAYAFDYFAYIFIAVCMATLSAWFVKSLAPWAAGSGIPEVKTILGGFVIKGCLGIMTLIVKIIGLVLAVGSGLTLGKEGPMVHVGGCVGNVFSRIFSKYRNNEAKKREMISASCAAGVACAFGTPAGGTLFSLEELSSYFPPKTLFRTFFACVIGALTLQIINPRPSGKIVLYSISYHVNWKWFELIAFIFLGIVGGLLGALFTKLNISFIKNVRKKYFGKWPILETIGLTILTSVLCYWNEYSRMPMSDLIARLFENTCTENSSADSIFVELCDPTNFWAMGKLMISFVLRFILLSLTVGIKIPSGVLVPSLAIGACYGTLVGSIMKYVQLTFPDSPFFQECYAGGEGSCVVPGMYAVIGAATMLGGVCRITVSLAVIMFELTGGLEYLVPIMLSVMFAKWVGDAFNRESIYELNIEMNQYPFLHNDEVDTDDTAKHIMTTHKLKVIFVEGATVGEVRQSLLREGLKLYGFPIVDNSDDRRVLGFITQAALQDALLTNDRRINDQTEIVFSDLHKSERQISLINKIDLSSFLDEIPIQVPTQMPGDRLYNMFRAMGVRYCLVLHNSKLVGIITKKDLVKWLHHGHSHDSKPSTPSSDGIAIVDIHDLATTTKTSLNIDSNEVVERKSIEDDDYQSQKDE